MAEAFFLLITCELASRNLENHIVFVARNNAHNRHFRAADNALGERADERSHNLELLVRGDNHHIALVRIDEIENAVNIVVNFQQFAAAFDAAVGYVFNNLILLLLQSFVNQLVVERVGRDNKNFGIEFACDVNRVHNLLASFLADVERQDEPFDWGTVGL